MNRYRITYRQISYTRRFVVAIAAAFMLTFGLYGQSAFAQRPTPDDRSTTAPTTPTTPHSRSASLPARSAAWAPRR